MRLIDLEPRWLVYEGKRMGFIFRCPTRPGEWQTCFFAKVRIFNGTGPRVDSGWCTADSQFGMVHALGTFTEAMKGHVQPCDSKIAWTCTPDPEQATFENISIMPSLDGSDAGNWHGHITNGQIVGGLPNAG